MPKALFQHHYLDPGAGVDGVLCVIFVSLLANDYPICCLPTSHMRTAPGLLVVEWVVAFSSFLEYKVVARLL